MMLKASMVAASTAALSLIAVPLAISPVPITGQTLGVNLSGLLLGPWWGAASMAVYLAAGVAGFPVFARGGSGLSTIIGPTGGYLLAFIPAAWLTGILAVGAPRMPRLFGAALGGSAVIHLAGSAYLAWQTKRTYLEALALGSLPFLAGDILKCFLASLIASRYRKAYWT